MEDELAGVPGIGGGGICCEVLSLLLDPTVDVDEEAVTIGLFWQLHTGSTVLTSAIFGL